MRHRIPMVQKKVLIFSSNVEINEWLDRIYEHSIQQTGWVQGPVITNRGVHKALE